MGINKRTVMETWYSKATPKVSDHNPILHSPFYTQSNPSPVRESMYRSSFSSRFHDAVRTPDRSLLARNAAKNLQGTSPLTNSFQTDRLYKTRPKNFFSNPITGTTHRFDKQPLVLEGLDVKINKDRYRSYITPGLFSLQNTHYSNNERISGALRRDVPSVTYVNPYLLKANKSPQVRKTLDPKFERSASKFFNA